MSAPQIYKPEAPEPERIIKLAIMAVGGQGGGVLTRWVETLARSQGYACQATSVAGVSQRTGATIYYIEMTPDTGRQPIFSLAPSAGDVDILVAAEMMEVGRAMIRGFVTPDRTVLIGSTHRALAVSEKSAPGNGIAKSEEVRAAAEIAARQLILADMDSLAIAEGSVISASLFGALAASQALPFKRDAFEDAIRSGGKGEAASLRAFAAGYTAAQQTGEATRTETVKPKQKLIGPVDQLAEWEKLINRSKTLPEQIQAMAEAGLMKVVDFQDCAYGNLYLDRLETVVANDYAAQNWALSLAAAKHLANAMAYDDVIRVADLKTRAPRFERIRNEMGFTDDKQIELTEFFHPRAEEIVSLMPAKLGERWENSPRTMALIDKLFNKGRRLRTHSLRSYLMLHALGGLKGYRLNTRRHAVETAQIKAWLKDSLAMVEKDYALAVELFQNRQLVKGYSDTHARGMSKFEKVMRCANDLVGSEDASERLIGLREAALDDPDGKALDVALRRV